jgi:hypothetical protein
VAVLRFARVLVWGIYVWPLAVGVLLVVLGAAHGYVLVMAIVHAVFAAFAGTWLLLTIRALDRIPQERDRIVARWKTGDQTLPPSPWTRIATCIALWIALVVMRQELVRTPPGGLTRLIPRDGWPEEIKPPPRSTSPKERRR